MLEESPHKSEERIGKYRLIGVLAEGGMARLYLAEQSGPQGFKKVVALKRVLPHLAGHPEFREMFLREAIVAARLDHPHIVTTYELGEVDGQYFISMEYLPGEDLAATVQRTSSTSQMPVEIAAAICQQCADALSYAHEFNVNGEPSCIVHRDVNPSNIVVTYHGEVKLLDFGIAKVRNSHADARSMSFKGKLSYAAPEQLSGEALDGRADIFCLGIVLWECLTGTRLFAGTSEAARLEAIRSKPIVPPSTFRKEVPPQLDEIVLKALARDRDQRFKTARELSDALLRFLAPPSRTATLRSIGAWLEALFGAERAAMKRATAQGHDLEKNLTALNRMISEERESMSPPPQRAPSSGRLRPVWSTDLAGGSSIRPAAASEFLLSLPALNQTTPSSVPAPPVFDRTYTDITSTVRPLARDVEITRTSQARVVLAAVAAVIVAVLVVALALRPGEKAPAERMSLGSLEVKSDPPGAQIIVDGEPTGLMTPAVLQDLPLTEAFEVTVEKPGYNVSPKKFTLASSKVESHSFKLEPAAGIVRLTGLSDRKASIYVDGVRVDATRPVELSIGPHEVRVELGQELIASRTINVVGGEQTVDLAKR